MSSSGQFHLLARRRFLPLFITQFLGAANDNVFKNALVILLIYRIGDSAGVPASILVTVAGGLLILPFFLFSATAGLLADHFEKSRLMQIIKFAEIPIMGLAAAGLFGGNVWFLLIVLFLLGTQATFFGPMKYAILPEHLAEDELIGGNALIEGGTFLAILIGTITGGLLILTDGGVTLVAVLMLALAGAGFAASLFIPKGEAGRPEVQLSADVIGETRAILRQIRGQRPIFLSVLGISWFWLVGATFLAQFPAFAKDVLMANEHVVTLLLTVFSIGIGVGSALCARLLGGEISARFVPFAALGMALFCADLWLASGAVVPMASDLAGLDTFLRHPANWRVLIDLALIAACGGLFIVPLYAIVQSLSAPEHRARIIAGNNIVNALFMVISALATAGLLAAGATVTQVFLAIAVANAVVAVYICGLLPDAVFKGLFSWLLRLAYKVEVHGLENLKAAGERVVIVINHVSFLDAVILATFLPGKPTFAINTFIARLWWVRPFLRVVDAFPLDPTNPLATKSLIRAVQEGRTLVIFPEGRITVTGSLMKIYEGPGMIADRSGAAIVPVRIDGAQYTPFSRLKGKVRLRWFPRISVAVLPPRRFEVPEAIKGRARRQKIGAALYDVMSDMIFETADRNRSLFTALLDARVIHGGDAPVIEDINRKPLDYDRLVLAGFALGRRLSRLAARGEAVGVLMPNAAGTVAAFFALQAFGRVPAMLNFTTGVGNVLSACAAARITTVLTSRRFVDQARLGGLVEALAARVRVVYLEDEHAALGLGGKLYGLLARPFARTLHRRHNVRPDEPAVILFTSGSEGTPKGVVLSHANILANCLQLGARVDFTPADIVFNALPVFHSFGLTGGLLLPVLSGLRTFLYPSPLHYRIVPELVYDTNATILFGTDTFLTGYARVAHPYDFYSVRYVFAGAEKVRDETRRTWTDKFGLRILEGYGATETAPVIATNTPMQFKAGTVGRVLPGMVARLEPVPGILEGGRLLVRGPNVMLGYLRAEHPGVLEPPTEGWHDTGDIVTIDEAGFVRITGRIKRFAKIAGEMVSLGAVETETAALWPAHHHAVVAIPDPRKGEQLILVTETPDADRATLLRAFQSRGHAELMVPRTILTVDRIPVLGTGKTDYVAVNALVRARVQGAEGEEVNREAVGQPA